MGTVKFPCGDVYVGQCRDGERNGRGTFTWPTGATHVGEFRDNNRSGHGTYTYPDGRVQEGEWLDGSFQGRRRLPELSCGPIITAPQQRRTRLLREEGRAANRPP